MNDLVLVQGMVDTKLALGKWNRDLWKVLKPWLALSFAMACVAGFIAGSSLPLSAAKRNGLSRSVHEKAGPLAIGFVVCATTFSPCTQGLPAG